MIIESAYATLADKDSWMYDEHFCLGTSLNGLCRLSAERKYNYSPVPFYLKLLCGICMNLLVKHNVWRQR